MVYYKHRMLRFFCFDLPMDVLFRAVEEGLTYQYHAAWASVLQVLRVFFEACGQQCHPIMQKVKECCRLLTFIAHETCQAFPSIQIKNL